METEIEHMYTNAELNEAIDHTLSWLQKTSPGSDIEKLLIGHLEKLAKAREFRATWSQIVEVSSD